MYLCHSCNKWFEEPDKVCKSGQKECIVCTEQIEVCPYCGEDNFESDIMIDKRAEEVLAKRRKAKRKMGVPERIPKGI